MSLPPEVDAVAQEMTRAGCSQREIGKLLGMSHVGIAKMERRARETGRLPKEDE
jgi:transposase